MAKKYNDRAMQVDREEIGDGNSVFFFPKNNPPVSVRANTKEEAEALLKDKKDIKDIQ
jgi:hypothetical protein